MGVAGRQPCLAKAWGDCGQSEPSFQIVTDSTKGWGVGVPGSKAPQGTRENCSSMPRGGELGFVTGCKYTVTGLAPGTGGSVPGKQHWDSAEGRLTPESKLSEARTRFQSFTENTMDKEEHRRISVSAGDIFRVMCHFKTGLLSVRTTLQKVFSSL